MNFERLLVTVHTPSGRERTEVWNTRRPLSIGHHSRFILERADQGVLVRRLPQVSDVIEEHASELIRDEDLAGGRRKLLPGNIGYSVEIKPLRTFRPAYHGSAQVLKPDQEQAVLAFSGVRRVVLHCRPIHAAFVAYAKGRPVMTVTKGPEGYRIKPLLPGLQVKVTGKSQQYAEVGQVFDLTFADFFTATFVRGIYWWRFSQAIGFSVDPERRDRPADREVRFFWKSFRWVFGLMLLASLAVRVLVPPPSQESQILHPPEIEVQVVQQKMKNYPRPIVAAELPHEVEVKKDVAVAEHEKVAPPPAGLEKGKESQVEGFAKAAIDPKALERNRAAVLEGQKQAAKKRQMEVQAKALRALMGDAKAMNAKSIALPSPNESLSQPLKSVNLPDATRPTALAMDSVAPKIRVEGIGGADNPKLGTGYLAPVEAKVNGQGKSLITIDPRSTFVEEGLTREEVSLVVQAHLSEVRYCYESSLLYRPKIEGKIQVQFKIGPLGKVKIASVQSSSVDMPKLDSCIVERLKTWAFPHPKGGVEVGVSYPFIFRTLSGAR